MSEFPSLSFGELCETISSVSPTLILLRHHPDASTVASALALRHTLEALGSPAYCICDDEIPDGLRFLAEDAQESLLPDSLPEDFFPERVIAVEAASAAQLGALREIYEGQIDLMLASAERIVPFAPYYQPDILATTGETLFDLVKALAENDLMKVSDALCTALYAAISARTNGFRGSNVTPETHTRAAELVASGIDHREINRRLFETRSLGRLRAMAAAISNLHLQEEGRLAVIRFPYAIKVALGLDDSDLGVLAEIATAPEGVRLAVVIRQPTVEPVFRVSVRSFCSLDASEICAPFGGSGNSAAAVCTVQAADADTALDKILSGIDFSMLN